jgi:hypothetical protein
MAGPLAFETQQIRSVDSDRLLGRESPGTGRAEQLTPAQARTILDVLTSSQIAAAYQPLDSDLTAIAALATVAFGRGALEIADAAAFRAYIGAGTSSFDGTFASLTGKPTTLAGYGITDGQPLDAELTAIAGLTSAADSLPYFTGSGTAALTTFTNFGRSLVDDADSSAGRSTLGLVIGTDVLAFDAGVQQIADLADPNADRMLFWDESANAYAYLSPGTNLNISGTSLNVSGVATDSLAFVTIGNTGSLSAERSLAAEASVLTLTDGGANSTATIGVATNGITFEKFQQITTDRFLGRDTAGTGNVEELTGTVATTLLDVFTSGAKGLAPASGGGTTNFLRADGTWTAPGGGGGAPTDAQYLTLATNGTLTDERVLAVGTGLDLTDGGAGGNATLDIDLSELTTTTPAIDDTFPFTDVSNSNANGKTTLESMMYEYRKVHHRYGFHFFTDFDQETSTTAAGAGLAEVNSGTGAGSSNTATTASNRVGLARSTTGTTATGRAALFNVASIIRLGGGEWAFEVDVNVTTLSTSSERFQLYLGFLDTNSTVNQTDAVAFYYDEGGVTTGSTAAAYWQTLTSSNATRTWNTSLTQTTVNAGQWYRLRITVNAAANSVEFAIDGTVVSTHTTNIPSGSGRELGFGVGVIKSVGTTARTVDYDFVNVVSEFTTPR